MTRQRAPLLALTAIGLAGLAISAYLTAVHLSAAPLVCAEGGPVNCGLVLSSRYGIIPGTALPTSAAGLAWFAVSLGLTAWQWVRPQSRLSIRLLQAWSFAGLAVALGLVYVEVVLLGAICAWCTGVHLLVLLTVLISLARRPQAS